MKKLILFILFAFYSISISQEKQNSGSDPLLKFNQTYKKETLKTKLIKFQEGYFDLYSTESFNFNRIINQKPKIDSETFDASGLVLFDETTQEIFWNKQNNPNTLTAGKISFYVENFSLPGINEKSDLSKITPALQKKLYYKLMQSASLNPPPWKLKVDTNFKVSYSKYNGNYCFYGKANGTADTDVEILLFGFFLPDGKFLNMKAIIAKDDRQLILENLIEKSLETITFYPRER